MTRRPGETTRAVGCFVLATTVAAVAPATARAQDKAACAASYEKAQVERQKDHLRASREQLLVCSQPSCSVLQKDCVQWLSEVEAALPSVVFEATGPDGRDAVDAQVTCDGAPVVSRIDGKAVVMDPGLHRCRFEMGGMGRDDQIVLHEGEQRRPWRISFATGATPSAPMTNETAERSSSAPLWPWVVGGLGIAAIGVGSYFELHGFALKSDLDACKGHCSPSSVDATRAAFVTGDVTIGVGLAAVAIAAIVLVTHSPGTPSGAEAWLTLRPGGALVEGRF